MLSFLHTLNYNLLLSRGGRLEETYKLATLSKSFMDFVKVIIWDFRKLDAVYKTLNTSRIKQHISQLLMRLAVAQFCIMLHN
jgi:hypothetical protein